MTISKTNAVISLIVAILLGGALSYTLFPRTTQLSAGAVGDTQTTPKMAQIQGNEASNSTYDSVSNQYVTVSLPNSNAQDRVISNIDLFYTGLGTVSTSTSAKTITCATSSVATSLSSNTNYVLNTVVATSSPIVYVSSSTPGLTGTVGNRIWLAGSYLNCQTNATSTATNIVKVSYIAE